MKCQGKFKFKGIQKKDGGSFTNPQGQVINFQPKYAVKVDEVGQEGIFERIFKVPLESPLIPQLANKQVYEDMVLEFDIQFTSKGTPTVTPINLIK